MSDVAGPLHPDHFPHVQRTSAVSDHVQEGGRRRRDTGPYGSRNHRFDFSRRHGKLPRCVSIAPRRWSAVRPSHLGRSLTRRRFTGAALTATGFTGAALTATGSAGAALLGMPAIIGNPTRPAP
jgi:hypothetical protein